MRFSDTFLEDIRQRLPISQVVGEFVQWDKKKSQPGRGDYWACCPFHGEKTPSFHADDRKGIYHCFGCGVTGDHFRFLTERGGLNFPEAVERLAGQAGIQIPARNAREEQRDRERKTLYDVMEMAAGYFEAGLAHNIGARARGYLNERGVSPKMQAQFRIGFAPDSRNGLKQHLADNGVTAEQMDAAGLVASREGDALSYDRFRNRVMFPIMDFRGRIIAFGGRALSADVPAKYLNSPETELFHKRMVLYNGQAARKAAQDGKSVVVVEGYLDVIAAVAAGFEGAVAPLGTALTEEHLALLWRMSDTPVLCFDGDDAGQRAMARTTDVAMPLLEPGRTIKVATLPQGLDPDDLIKQQGPAAFGDLIAKARTLSDVVWGLETGGVLPDTPEARAALEAKLRGRVNAIRDQSVRRHYSQAMDERLQAFFGGRGRTGGQQNRRDQGRGNWNRQGGYGQNWYGRGQSPKVTVSDTLRNSRLLSQGSSHQVTPREAVIVMSLINHPQLAEARLEKLAELEFGSPAARQILAGVIDLISGGESTGEAVIAGLVARGHGAEVDRMGEMLTRHGIWQSGADIAEMDAETGLNHALALHNKSVQLNRELKAAELALGQDPSEESFERLRDIQNQITSVDGTEALIEGFGSLSGRATPGF